MQGFFKFGSPTIFLVLEGMKLEFLLDTGFTGQIMLPYEIIARLDLEQIAFSDYVTASGEHEVAKTYKATIELLGEKQDVFVLGTEANFSLAGISLFDSCRITLDKKKDLVLIEGSQ